MDNKIRLGIVGYGNLGKGVELAIRNNEDMELIAIFTRRKPDSIKTYSNVIVKNIDEIESFKDKIDVMILCGGSATDLPMQGPTVSKLFNTIDSFDTHAKISEYFKSMDESAKIGNKVSIISIGWDPGLFSLNRLLSETILPKGNTYTFCGKGVSQGHSDAIRRIEGVKNAIQYTIPIDESVEKVRNGENPDLSARQKHLRQCFVVVEDGADKQRIENQIKNMPNYFSDYDTTVNFISEEELKANHSKMPHGGFVIRSGVTGENAQTKQIMEYSLNLESNPEFTSNVLISYARAAYKLYKNNDFGAKTIFDISPSMLTAKSNEELLKNLL